MAVRAAVTLTQAVVGWVFSVPLRTSLWHRRGCLGGTALVTFPCCGEAGQILEERQRSLVLCWMNLRSTRAWLRCVSVSDEINVLLLATSH